MSKFALRNALNLIAGCKLTFHERVVVQHKDRVLALQQHLAAPAPRVGCEDRVHTQDVAAPVPLHGSTLKPTLGIVLL